MLEQLLEHIDQAQSVRGVKRAASWIYQHYAGQNGKDWGQKRVQEIVVEKKTQLKGSRPTRRGRSGQ